VGRDGYEVFSKCTIGKLTLKNRLVRSATADPPVYRSPQITDELLTVYRELAIGGVGMIITGKIIVAVEGEINSERRSSINEFWIEGLEKMAEVVHDAADDCKIIAQLGAEGMDIWSSDFPDPFSNTKKRVFSVEEIQKVEDCFVGLIRKLKKAGFDGVQLHGAHGYVLCSFLSPYMNRRTDEYGGSIKNRVRIVREIVSKARESVGDYPILIKMNCTDNMDGGINIDTFPEMAKEIESTGVDAIEVSGGIWQCLARTEEELGFRPVPIAESHTRINTPEKQHYYLKYAERLDLNIPVILVGGNKDIELMEQIVHQGKVDFMALCRPLISEPDLPNRWLEGRGSNTTDCISCNSCLYPLWSSQKPFVFTCLYKQDKEQYRKAQKWLKSFVKHAIENKKIW